MLVFNSTLVFFGATRIISGSCLPKELELAEEVLRGPGPPVTRLSSLYKKRRLFCIVQISSQHVRSSVMSRRVELHVVIRLGESLIARLTLRRYVVLSLYVLNSM